jgi:hypothetical protein
MKRVFLGLFVSCLVLFSFSMVSAQLTVVSGNITSDTTWSGEVLLRGAVFVQPPATLTIQPGTIIYGEQATIGTLIIAQGARIHAVGTPADPIVFTSENLAVGLTPARGDWGGLIINGYAPINIPGGIAYGEGDTGAYGGSNPNDNSGTLQYVRVEYAGHEFSPENELNGIALQGVGDGTTIDHVQVHMNADDGIEMFGGTVGFKYALVTNCRDDSFDCTDGWTGKAQFLVCQQRADDADNGFEWDNNAENNDYTPRTHPTVYNVTLIGDPTFTYGEESDLGMLLREGTAGDIYNAIVMGFKDAGLELDHAATFTQAQLGNLVIGNSIFSTDLSSTYADQATADVVATWSNIAVLDPMIMNPYSQSDPDFRPAPGSPAVTGAVPVAPPPSDGFFEPVTFIGGVNPDNNWTLGWTNLQICDIKANGADSLTITSADTLSVTVSINPWTISGVNADWWIAAATPFGWHYYVYPTGWFYGPDVADIQPAYQGALFGLGSTPVLDITGLPAGAYAFFFAVDTNMNGQIDGNRLKYDGVAVTVN